MLKRIPEEVLAKYKKWRPVGWLGRDARLPPPPSDEALKEAIKALAIVDEAKRADVIEHIRKLADDYWAIKIGSEAPPLSRRRVEVDRILVAIENLLEVLRTTSVIVKSEVMGEFSRWTGHELSHGTVEHPSIEEQLAEFLAVCRTYAERRASKGRKRIKQLSVTAKALSDIWKERYGEPIPKSFAVGSAKTDKNPDKEDEFSSAGPLFAQLVFKAIDSDITIAEIRTGLRSLPSSRKSRSKKKRDSRSGKKQVR